jgi:hypothetical protein
MNEAMNGTMAKNQQILPYPEKDLEPVYQSTLTHIEKILEYTEAIGINDLLLEKAASHLAILGERLGVSPMQGALFCLLFSMYNNTAIDQGDLANLLKCTPVKLLHYMNDLEELQKKRLLNSRLNGGTPVFRIPADVVNTLRKKDEFTPESRVNIGIDDLFGVLEDLFGQASDEEITIETLHSELESLIRDNLQLMFCRKLMSYNFPFHEVVLLLCFCHLFVNNDDDNIGFHDFQFLFEKRSQSRYVFREFKEGDHVLIEAKFIENTNDEGFVNRESFKLTDHAKKDLLAELDVQDIHVLRKKGLMLWDSLTPKKLFYNEREAQSVEELAALLQEDHFKKVQERLGAGNMRKGFACLFSGCPGTGKTETVYQIARETKRNIMLVDISAIKGMFVGETEKHIKAVFDNYRQAAQASDIAPILFFNEADAVIGKRIEFSSSSRAVDRMENTMQNIILQELENLDGILIATTNLTKNMDQAFERRFLYKIDFEKPSVTARALIWKAMLPALAEHDAGELASRFDFSGGQIENVVRKSTVRHVLSGDEPSLDNLSSFCRDELLGKEEEKVIGFASYYS